MWWLNMGDCVLLSKPSSLTSIQPVHYRFLSNVEVGGICSTSLSSRAIGSALVDRLKLQSHVAPREERDRERGGRWRERAGRDGAKRYRIKIERRKRRDHDRLWITFFDRRWSDPIGQKSTRMIRGWYRQERRVLIRPVRFQFLPVDLKEDACSSA